MTPTRLIYEAWRRTPQPMPLPNGKTVRWADPRVEDVPDEPCWLCGSPTAGRGLPTKKAIRSTFTDNYSAKAPESTSVCEACGWTLDQKYLRNYSLLVLDSVFRHPSKTEIRDLCLRLPQIHPWLLSIAGSGQKHLSFHSYVNLSPKTRRILAAAYNYEMKGDKPSASVIEGVPIDLPEEGLGFLLRPIETLYAGGFNKYEIERARYRQDRIREFGVRRWRILESHIEPHRGSMIFGLAIFVAKGSEGHVEEAM